MAVAYLNFVSLKSKILKAKIGLTTPTLEPGPRGRPLRAAEEAT
jgi:hypothetical protein